MYRSTIRTSLTLVCVGSLTFCFGGGASIGIATINGTATVDNASVRGNTSILDGSVVETAKGSSHLSLSGGARVEFASDSRGKVYRDHVVLEKGMGQLHAGNSFPILANSLQVVPSGSDSTVRVSVKDSKSILVGAVSGEAKVLNSHGLLLAKVMPGRTYEFDQEAGAAAQARVSGCVERRGGKYYVRDDTSGVVSEISGTGLDQYNRKHVDVAGSIDTAATPGSGATQVIRVGAGAVTNASAAGCATPGMGAGTGAGAAAGVSHGAVIAIIAGVSVAAVLGGLAAAGEFSGTESSR
ncbi:MAG: hypothetical protein ACR2NN_08325 [Bryobacteraceae bacterium]